MCDAMVLERDSRWPRRLHCDRKGKYTRTVQKVYDDTETKFVVDLCGQHKNMIERGDRLYIRRAGMKEDVTVRGEMSEVGVLEREAKEIQREIESNVFSMEVRKDSLGKIAVSQRDELIKLCEGNENLRGFVRTLQQYDQSFKQAEANRAKMREIEVKVRELKSHGK